MTDNNYSGIFTRSTTPSTKGITYKYNYFLTREELMRSYYIHPDLPYALKKEIGRDRFIMNSAAVEKEMTKVCEKILEEAVEQIITMLSQDASNVLQSLIDAVPSGNVKVNVGQHASGQRIVRMLTSQLVNEMFNIMDNIMQDLDK